MRIAFAGGAMEVGGSCIYLRTEQYGILMDAGIRQGTGRDPIPDFRLIQEMGGVDVIFISHAHMDHIGTLPIISKAYPNAPIYMTPMTCDLTRVLLWDSLKIMAQREEEIPHYLEGDVSAMMDRIIPLHVQAEREVLKDLSVTFYPAGHIAGAVCMQIRTPEGTVFYSGDYASFVQQTIEGIRVPKLRPDVVITESTYGNKLHANRQVEEKRLVQLVGDAVKRGDKVLIPSFALGRSQEVLLLLKAGIQNGEIPKVPVYVDGMVRDVCRVYKQNPTYLRGRLARSILKGHEPFYSDEIRPVLPTDDRKELLAAKGPAVFVSSSGMLTGGPSVQYAEAIASMASGLILITGYQDEEAPGRFLLNLMDEARKKEGADEAAEPETDEEKKPEPIITLNGHVIPVRCRVEQVGLSAHGDQSEILGLLGLLSPRDVILVHGDREIIGSLTPMVTGEHLQHVYAPQCGDILELSYRKLRKQIRPELAYHMNCEGFPDEEGERALWSFVLEHYPEREMTAMQLAEVYQTKPIVEDETIRAWQGMLSQSVYFEPNIFRLFLFHARTREEVEETLAPKEWTQQEVGEAVREFFQAFPFKKAGYYHDRREVLLTLDFPDAVDRAAFDAAATAFHETTGWKATLNSSMNHASVQQLILSLFGDRVLRYSYYETDRTYRVQLAGGKKLEDQEKIQTFQERTGWKLLTGSEKIGQKTAEDLTVRPSPAAHKMEQNAAIAYIRHCAEDWKDALQKVGVKTDAIGRYIELTFMTPQIGARYEESIRTLSEEVGWPLRMNRAVMQNLVLSQASLSCAAHGLELRKNPSFIPSSQSVQLKVQMGHEKEEAETAEEILLKTGLACTFVH